MSTSSFLFRNSHTAELVPTNIAGRFTIKCMPNTDIWTKPPSIFSFNAPILFRSVTVKSFHSAKVNISGPWEQKYDQGGLCLVINPRSGSAEKPKQWVKTGIEFLNDVAHISTVATDRWSDWSLRPTSKPGETTATIEMVSEDDNSLWMYMVDDGGNKSPIREVTWWGTLSEDLECWIGVYAARPSKDGGELKVDFQDLVLETK